MDGIVDGSHEVASCFNACVVDEYDRSQSMLLSINSFQSIMAHVEESS